MAGPLSARTRVSPVRLGLGLLVLVWGVQAVITQSLLLREALVLMFGSELAWGIVLFAWLFGVAVGAACGSVLAVWFRRSEITLIVVLVLLSLIACGEIWVFRSARLWFGVGAGELLPLPKTAMAAILFVAPCSLFIGMAFPLACAAGVTDCDRSVVGAGPLGGIYALESAGSLIGGAIFSFWLVEHWPPIQTALAGGAITFAAAAVLLLTRRQVIPAVLLLVPAVGGAIAAFAAGTELNGMLVRQRWNAIAPGYQLRTETESRYQNLAIGQRFDQYALYCDGQIAASFPDPHTIAPQTHFWMCQHPDPRRVLVLGGGAEGLLAEILRYPVEHVDYVEPDPRQIELVEPFLPQADRVALADPRVTIHHVDGRHFIKELNGRFDLVIARLPEPMSALRARFFTTEFYGKLRRAMSPRGVLCTTVAAMPTRLSTASARYLASVRATLRTQFPQVVVTWGDPAQIVAATEAGLITTDGTELARRYRQARAASPWFDPHWFTGGTDMFDPAKIRERSAELDAAADAQVSTDLRPILYMQRLALWERMIGGRGGQLVERLLSIGWRPVALALAAIGILTLAVCRLRRTSPTGWQEGAVVLSVATTGFATMALSIIWLFAFQNLYGYVYQRIGWIIAIFMAGLVLGCFHADRRSKRFNDPARLSAFLWQGLIVVDVLLACLAVTAPVWLPALGRMQATPGALVLVECSLSLLVLLTGVLGGAAFPLAGGLQMGVTSRPGQTAGLVVGADHAGACLGALLTGLLLVPVLGTPTAAFLLAGMKLASAMILFVVGKPSRTIR